MENFTRREFLAKFRAAAVSAGSISLLSYLGLSGCITKSREKPNVILVMTDDQGYGDIGGHGSPYVKTPTLDRLYQESVRLTNFHVDPCCAPTRASLLTGQYSIRSGVWHTIGGRSLLQQDKLTMADIFSADGYQTGIFGKWHLGENYPFRPQDRGFSETLVHGGGVVGQNPDFWGNDYYDDTYMHNGKPEKFVGYCNDVWFDAALDFITANRDRPFFCYLPTNLPHAPLNVDEKYSEPYRAMVSDQLADYYGMLTKFDEDLSRLLQQLEDMELAQNTIFIFLSDNGPCPWFGGIKINADGFVEEGYSAGMRGGKIWGYENAHRVPCFIRWPAGGIAGGKNIDRLTAHFDLLPTLIDLCGLKSPETADFDGSSLKPLLQKSNAQWTDRTLFVHNQRVDFPEKYKEYQVLTERWRLVKRDQEELYDIRTDPGQRKNIAEQHPAVVARLHQEYEKWWQDISSHIDQYNEIIIGSDRENPAVLYSHDAHRKERELVWVIAAAKTGRYEFKVSRWPQEANKPISETKEGLPFINTGKAHLIIGNIKVEHDIVPEDKSVRFEAALKTGTTCLQAWFLKKGSHEKIRADYVYVKYLGPAQSAEIIKYSASDPDQLLKEVLQ